MVVEIEEERRDMTGETEPVQLVLGVWVTAYSVVAPAERLVVVELVVVVVGKEVDFVSVVSVAPAAAIVLAAIAGVVVVDFEGDTVACTVVAVAFVADASAIVEKE